MFPVKYEPNSYISFRRISVFKGLISINGNIAVKVFINYLI
jgi:hypothetical protein